MTARKDRKDRKLWRTWIPDLVIEVVSESSRDRDYTEKRDEYWTLGVKEYWIVDAKLEQVLILRRGRSQWTEKRSARRMSARPSCCRDSSYRADRFSRRHAKDPPTETSGYHVKKSTKLDEILFLIDLLPRIVP